MVFAIATLGGRIKGIGVGGATPNPTPHVEKEHAMSHSNSIAGKSPKQVATNRTGVYLWTNLVNKKVYVGSATISFRARFKHHRGLLRRNAHSNKHWQNAWNKYGEGEWSYTEIEVCDPDVAIEREQHWMDHYDSANPEHGYNLAPKAGSSRGVKWAEAKKRALSDKLSKQRETPEYREMMSKIIKEAWDSDPDYRKAHQEAVNNPEYKERHSKRMKEQWKDEEYRAKVEAARKEALQSPEIKEKFSAAQKKKWSNPEYKKRMSEIQKEALNRPEVLEKLKKIANEMWESEEVRKKHHEATTKAWDNEERRLKHSKKMKEVTSTPEAKARSSASAKERWEDPEHREKASKAIREALSDPEVKARMAASIKATKSTREFKEHISKKMKEVLSDPKLREKISQNTKAAFANPEIRKRHLDATRVLTDDQVREIRKMKEDGCTLREIREKFKVAVVTIRWVLKRRGLYQFID